jgi:hypothetical protein
MTHAVQTTAGEEEHAAVGAVLSLSVGVGAVAAIGSALIGDPLILLALPTAALALAMVTHHAGLAGFGAALVWLALLPRAGGDALVVPLAMGAACAVIGVGRERLARFVEVRREPPETAGWIEEA